MTGRTWFHLTILVLGLTIWATAVWLIKLRTGKSVKMVVTDRRLQQACLGLAVVALVVIFAVFVYVNN